MGGYTVLNVRWPLIRKTMDLNKRMYMRMKLKGDRVKALSISKRYFRIRRLLKGMINEW